MKNYIYSVCSALKESRRNETLLKSPEFETNRLEAEIIRNVHSIEKGLSIRTPRAGFGIHKINEMFTLVERYMRLCDEKTVLFLVVDAVSEYLEFQANIGFDDPELDAIRTKNNILSEKIGPHDEKCGGTLLFGAQEACFNVAEIERLFNTRHSIREFSGKSVSKETILRAVELAQRAPSACNRQAVRVYGISSHDYIKSVGNLDGIGGFAEDVDQFLLITGVKSAYRRGEKNQFAVSASMFAAYLTLSLHALGVGVCTVQRALGEDKVFVKFRQLYGIPEDEQIVVMLGIGMLCDEMKVPVSKRYPLEKIYRHLNI